MNDFQKLSVAAFLGGIVFAVSLHNHTHASEPEPQSNPGLCFGLRTELKSDCMVRMENHFADMGGDKYTRQQKLVDLQICDDLASDVYHKCMHGGE